MGKFKKIAKLVTIRKLPEAIKYGIVIADNVANTHNDKNGNKTFAYIEYPTNVDGNNIVLRIAIKKSPPKNKFWLHSIYTIENASNSPASNINDTEAGHIIADDKVIIPDSAKKKQPL